MFNQCSAHGFYTSVYLESTKVVQKSALLTCAALNVYKWE